MPKQPTAEIEALITTALDAFNRKDAAVFTGVFGGEVVIIDGFAPFRWIGPDAAARWWADAEVWAHNGGVTKEHIAVEEIRYSEVDGSRGYAVLSATLTITLKAAQPIVRNGILVYTFGRQNGVWKAEGHAWGRSS